MMPIRRTRSACCARAASGHDAAAPPSAASTSRRPMVTVMRPSRARVRKCNDTTQCLGDLEIDHQLESAWAFDRQGAHLGAPENSIYLNPGASIHVRYIWTIGHERTGFGELSKQADCRQAVFQRQLHDVHSFTVNERRGEDDHPIHALAHRTIEHTIEVTGAPDGKGMQFDSRA